MRGSGLQAIRVLLDSASAVVAESGGGFDDDRRSSGEVHRQGPSRPPSGCVLGLMVSAAVVWGERNGR